MKRFFNYLTIAALIFGANMALVSADNSATVTESGDTNADVTVGDVEVPVYSVNISWDNFVFDWKYNDTENAYGWSVHDDSASCTAITYAEIRDDNQFLGKYYSDNACQTLVSIGAGGYDDDDVFYTMVGAGAPVASIYITDTSAGGRVTPTLTWTPVSKYDFTTATFKYFKDTRTCVEIDGAVGIPDEAYTNADCSGDTVAYGSGQQGTKYYDWEYDEDHIEFNGTLTPAMVLNHAGAGIIDYQVELELGVDGTKTVTTPTANDKIGTVTISIEAN